VLNGIERANAKHPWKESAKMSVNILRRELIINDISLDSVFAV
jgi:hypothetical protein